MRTFGRDEADFIFLRGGDNVFIVNKDSKGILSSFVVLTEFDVICFLKSMHKTIVADIEGNVIAVNFEATAVEEKKEMSYGMTMVHSFLSEVEQSYSIKEQTLDSIDRALVEGDRDTFMKLTTELYH